MGFIKNIRRGFATNSSSSHSFVYMREPDTTESDGYIDTDFGWRDFRLSSVKEKLMYVVTDRFGNNWNGTEEELAEAYESHKDDFPELSPDEFASAWRGYVDHESSGLIGPNEARDPYVTVFGGNDNDGHSELRLAAVDEIDWTRTEPGWAEESAGLIPKIKRILKRDLAKNALETSEALATAAEATGGKYHINDKGEVRPCKARVNPCRFATTDHYTDKGEALQAAEKRYSS